MSEEEGYPQIDPEVKKQWVAALKSGDYRQGELWLLSKSTRQKHWRYCCLGVLCEIQNLPKLREVTGRDYRMIWMMFEGGAETALPPDLGDKIGLHYEAEEKLISMNDEGVSFKKIAKWIEENL